MNLLNKKIFILLIIPIINIASSGFINLLKPKMNFEEKFNLHIMKKVLSSVKVKDRLSKTSENEYLFNKKNNLMKIGFSEKVFKKYNIKNLEFLPLIYNSIDNRDYILFNRNDNKLIAYIRIKSKKIDFSKITANKVIIFMLVDFINLINCIVLETIMNKLSICNLRNIKINRKKYKSYFMYGFENEYINHKSNFEEKTIFRVLTDNKFTVYRIYLKIYGVRVRN